MDRVTRGGVSPRVEQSSCSAIGGSYAIAMCFKKELPLQVASSLEQIPERESMSRRQRRSVQPDAAAMRRLRDLKGWKQAELAERARISLGSVSHIENGKPVFRHTLAQAAQALGVRDLRAVLIDETPPADASSPPSCGSAPLDETTAHIMTLHRQLNRTLGVTREDELSRLVGDAVALGISRGYAAPETEQALIRAYLLCQEASPEALVPLYRIIQGLCNAYIVKGQLRTGQKLTLAFCSLARRMRDPVLLTAARSAVGGVLSFSGQFARVRKYLEKLLASPASYMRHPADSFADTRVVCLGYLAHALYALGYPDQAREHVRQAHQRAHELAHGYSLTWICHFGAALYQLLREPSTTAQWAQEEIAQSSHMPFRFWRAGGLIQQGWATAMQGQPAAGIAQMHRGIQAWRATGAVLALPRWLTLLAEAYAQTDQPEEGLPALDEALLVVAQTGDRHYEAEIYRLRGKLWVQRSDDPDASHAERAFQKSLDVSRRQHAKSLELRAAMDMSRLWKGQGKAEEASELLAPVYNWFAEGFDTADLQEASSLLEELT